MHRQKLKVSEKTCSLWAYLNQNDMVKTFTNPLYEHNPDVIWPSVAPVSIELWRELYFSHNSITPWNGLLECAIEVKNKHSAIKKVAVEMNSQMRQVLQEIKLSLSDSTDCNIEQEIPELAQLNLDSKSA